MDIIKQNDDGSLLLKIDKNESVLIIGNDGEIQSHIAMDEGSEFATRSALEASIALIALADPLVRSICMGKIQQ